MLNFYVFSRRTSLEMSGCAASSAGTSVPLWVRLRRRASVVVRVPGSPRCSGGCEVEGADRVQSLPFVFDVSLGWSARIEAWVGVYPGLFGGACQGLGHCCSEGVADNRVDGPCRVFAGVDEVEGVAISFGPFDHVEGELEVVVDVLGCLGACDVEGVPVDEESVGGVVGFVEALDVCHVGFRITVVVGGRRT